MGPTGRVGPALKGAGEIWRAARGAFVLLVLLTLPGWVLAGSRAPAGSEESPSHILIALDPGGPPSGESWQLLSQAARLLITLLPDEDRLGLLALGDKPRVLLAAGPLTPAHRKAALGPLRPGAGRPRVSGPAALLAENLQQIAPEKGRRALVVLAAGSRPETGSWLGEPGGQARLLSACREHQIPIYVLELGKGSASGFLVQAAAATGGRWFPADTPAVWPPACLALFQHLKSPQMAPMAEQGVLLDPSVRRAVWFLPRIHPSRPAALKDPGGRELRPGRPGEQVDWQAGTGFDLVTLRGPQAGLWEARQADLTKARCFLDTDLRLEAWVPGGELWADACPRVGATLTQMGKVLTDPVFLANTDFCLELIQPSGARSLLRLSEASPGCGPGMPAGSRFGLLPEPLPPGPWEARVRGENKSLRRERLLPLEVRPPLYAARPDGPERLRLGPAGVSSTGAPLAGWLTVRSQPPGLAGSLVQTGPDGVLRCNFAGLPPGEHQLMAQLRGFDPPGCPLVIRPGPIPVAGTKAATRPPPPSRWGRLQQRLAKALPSPPSLSLSPAKKRRMVRFLGTAGGLGIVALGGWLAFGLWRRRRTRPGLPEEARGSSALLTAEQLQAVLQEKARLEARVQEMAGELRLMQDEKAKIQGEWEGRSRDLQEKSRRIAELEAEAEKAREEARVVQEEYTALYVRSQKEKKALQQA